jgi:hypothetical protein
MFYSMALTLHSNSFDINESESFPQNIFIDWQNKEQFFCKQH